MKLSKIQFEQLLQGNDLILSLVGMSNIGKTYWSKKYLSLEQKVMEDIFVQAKNGKKQGTIMGTTGSVIHTSRNICDKFRQYLVGGALGFTDF